MKNCMLFSWDGVIDALLIRKVYKEFISCPSLLGTLSIRVSVINVRDFNAFHNLFSRNKYLFVCCSLTANEICNNVNIYDIYLINMNPLIFRLIRSWGIFFFSVVISLRLSGIQYSVEYHICTICTYAIYLCIVSFTFYLFDCANSVIGF